MANQQPSYFNPGPASQVAVNSRDITTANYANSVMRLGGRVETSWDAAGNPLTWIEGGVTYTATYSNNVLSTVTAAGIRKTFTYPNGILQVDVTTDTGASLG